MALGFDMYSCVRCFLFSLGSTVAEFRGTEYTLKNSEVLENRGDPERTLKSMKTFVILFISYLFLLCHSFSSF